MYVCMYACMHACMHACMYVRMCAYVYIYTHTCAYTCIYIYVYEYCIYVQYLLFYLSEVVWGNCPAPAPYLILDPCLPAVVLYQAHDVSVRCAYAVIISTRHDRLVALLLPLDCTHGCVFEYVQLHVICAQGVLLLYRIGSSFIHRTLIPTFG